MEKGSTYKRRLFYFSWVAFLLLPTGCGEEAGWKPVVSQQALDNPPRAIEWRLEHGFDLRDVWTENGTDIGAVGEGGVMLYSSNGAQTWNQQRLSSPTNEALYAIHGEGDRLWAVGSHGVIVHTDDGGQTWNEQSSTTSETLDAIHGEGDQLWKEKGERAAGFLMALHMVRQKYGPECDQNAETADA